MRSSRGNLSRWRGLATEAGACHDRQRDGKTLPVCKNAAGELVRHPGEVRNVKVTTRVMLFAPAPVARR
jgi:hypothetical protein